MIIDTHCHLFEEDYENIDEIIKGMPDNLIMIVSGTNDKTNKEVIKLCDKYKNVFGTIGIHPSEINSLKSDSLQYIESQINHPKIVGIGEIGLDYYWVKDNKEEQKELFISQLELASKYNKTVVIHTRESIQDIYDILKSFPQLKKVLHAYSGSVEMAHEFIKINSKLGVGGVVTFKNAKNIKEVVENIDLDYLLLETDSPYLTPEPYRGQRNTPNNVLKVAYKIAGIKAVENSLILSKTTKNAIEMFDLEPYL